ncbi:bacteriohemerythrin [Paramagnetospirillum magneticum]|uniref:Hemerythrin-like protein CAC0069 n=1 Tax=Paramagnetospirillum magneticum (strain ATCC 700264 / AMB-1) TaxID=342108 RepID=Q2W8T6_PARM1|nr:hemerythrin family protein [Paramagnetospirillum magneticum]BAE49739.1 Hemerythrin-like protein CAC0069 [Paramagnetospirillum magneticum AMB-1]
MEASGAARGAIPEWTPEMSVGNDTLDSDHKAFFDIARLLYDSLADKRDQGLIIASTLLILEEYVDGHFLREEKALKAVGYTQLSEHHHKHRKFQARVRAISETYQSGTKSAADDLPDLVVKWLTHHILNEDMQYKRWIRDSAVDPRPLALLAAEAAG